MPPTSGDASNGGLKAPSRIETARLVLRRPIESDADAIFTTYASDPEVTRYVGFPRHAHVDDTRAFIGFSDAQWTMWPAGPYLICLRDGGALIGSTGLSFETPSRAQTGYVLARQAWGQGYATEALAAMTELAPRCGVCRLFALCHHRHRPSAHVLDKGGFALEGVLHKHAVFPNLDVAEPQDCLCYSRVF